MSLVSYALSALFVSALSLWTGVGMLLLMAYVKRCAQWKWMGQWGLAMLLLGFGSLPADAALLAWALWRWETT
jgi:hypothetical protein